MIADFKPYPAYKDSGLPWLGCMPARWKLLRSKYLFREVDQRSVSGDEIRLSMSQKLGLIPSSRIEEHRLVSENQVGAKICEAGYLVLNRLKAHLGVFALASERGLVSPDYTVFRPIRPMEAKYFEAFYRTPECRIELRRRAKGIVEGFWRLYTDDFYDICAPVPSQDEQAAIVRFLDYANRMLERVIRAKRKVIALLNEQKQAIICRAVTRGLDPNAPLKPSGIPWLGDMPAHWGVKRLKWVTRLQRGYDLPADRRRSGSIPVVSSGGVIDSHCESRVKGPGVVMGRYGSTDAVFYVEEDFWPHNTALFVTDFHGNVPKWCFYLLRTISKSDYSSKSAVPGVDRKDLYEIYVPHPPNDEQVGLIYGIEKQSAAFDSAIKSIEHEVALLREYRIRLTADVVTGKLDVRGAAALLLDKSYEPDGNLESENLEVEAKELMGDEEVPDE